MKIAHVVSTYPPYRGGMGAVAFEYVERLRDRRHQAHVFTPRQKSVRGDASYVHRLWPLIRWGNAAFVPSLLGQLADFDVVHLHYPFFGGAEPAALCRAFHRRQPLVMTYHMDMVQQGFEGKIAATHRWTLFPWIVGRADEILCSSREYAETSALKNVRGALNKLAVHPFGVDTDAYHPGGEPATRQLLEIKPDEPVLIFVGGLDRAHYFKGLPVLFEALSGLLDQPWTCLIIGDGDLRATYEENAKSRGVFPRLRFLGCVSEEDKRRLFRAADVHVFPSIDRSEAFGLVTLEAAASGIPSVVSDLPGVSSVVKNNETGLHVPPGDAGALRAAIAELLKDPERRKILGTVARKRAEAEYSWETCLDRLEAVYRKWVKEKAG